MTNKVQLPGGDVVRIKVGDNPRDDESEMNIKFIGEANSELPDSIPDDCAISGEHVLTLRTTAAHTIRPDGIIDFLEAGVCEGEVTIGFTGRTKRNDQLNKKHEQLA